MPDFGKREVKEQRICSSTRLYENSKVSKQSEIMRRMKE